MIFIALWKYIFLINYSEKKKISILYVPADTDKKFKDPKVKKRVF